MPIFSDNLYSRGVKTEDDEVSISRVRVNTMFESTGWLGLQLSRGRKIYWIGASRLQLGSESISLNFGSTGLRRPPNGPVMIRRQASLLNSRVVRGHLDNVLG